ncbi:MAG: DEAD/DEAH box helicase [Bacteroidales bacterium]|jgi:ATP-dependent RNA helicase RhlE
MSSFEELNLSKQLQSAIDELGFISPTPIQAEAYPVILSGRDIVGIAQTGTGKTFAYLLPLLRDLKFSKEIPPRILILVPTRELVIQAVEQIGSLVKYLNVRVLGVFGGVNINTQKQNIALGTDILVATPGRLYDLVVNGSLQLKAIKKLVIDEVDIMLDEGFRFQLTNIFDLLPARRQNIMFSATMTEEIDELIDDFFVAPVRISIAVSGTRLENIAQKCYPVQNFNTKINLLKYLLADKDEFRKVLVFVASKSNADRLFEAMEESLGTACGIIHSNKTQNFRMKSIQHFEKGRARVLIATDVMARGLDFEKITHVINFDTPKFPENYMHRIGRTGRAEEPGKSILFYTPKEDAAKEAIETLMVYTIPVLEFPEEVEISKELIPEEKPKGVMPNPHRNQKLEVKGASFHEKKLKNTKTNQGGSYLRKGKVYKKPQTRGDKIANQRRGK